MGRLHGYRICTRCRFALSALAAPDRRDRLDRFVAVLCLARQLDPSTQRPDLVEKGVLGELWAMHAGGFYNPQKYVVAPKQLPETLHWFFWPSYSTFITGFLLMTTLYYLQASYYMIDPAKAAISPLTSVLIGLGTLAGGWLVYDMLPSC